MARSSADASPHVIDGARLISLMAAGARAIETNREDINALNVFPVPDGDTGTNMVLTMRSVLESAPSQAGKPAGEVASSMARAALLGARGNSGLILAQFFKGLAACLEKSPELGAAEFAGCLRAATRYAYAAVPDPQEGTMLTVFRESAEAATEAASDKPGDLVGVWEAAAHRSRDAVARTPTMLDVLREAGVVDSGGYGFSVLLAGALGYLKGETDGRINVDIPEAKGIDQKANGKRVCISAEFLASVEEEAWGYCTSFAVEGEGVDVARLRKQVAEAGKSAVVAGDDTLAKVHVHVEDPGRAISLGAAMGTLSNVSVLNMDEQTAEWASERREDVAQHPVAIVAVVPGDGFARLFEATGLGACTTITGGDTMNPSTADLLAAVEGAPSDSVILLPNNKNIVGTARQVPVLAGREVRVVSTEDVPSGIAAMLAFSTSLDAAANAAAMQEAALSVRSAAVCRAARSSSMNGTKVGEGQIMGMLDGRLAAVGDDPAVVVLDLLEKARLGEELVTLYPGSEIADDAARACAELVQRSLPDIEVEVVRGDQPYYHYFLAIE